MSKRWSSENRWCSRTTWCPPAHLLHLRCSHRWQRPWWSAPIVMHENGDGYTTSMGCAARMIIPGRAWNLCRPGTTLTYLGMNRYPWSNGNK
eukprot:5801023-Amphidinium_carterae.1